MVWELCFRDRYEGVWSIEAKKNGGNDSRFYDDDLGQPSFNIMVRQYPVRSAVKEKNMDQCGPICYLTNGYLAGMLEELMGEKWGWKFCMRDLSLARKESTSENKMFLKQGFYAESMHSFIRTTCRSACTVFTIG